MSEASSDYLDALRRKVLADRHGATSVDTDALRNPPWSNLDAVGSLLDTAADEVDRLRESRDAWKRLANDERGVTNRLRAELLWMTEHAGQRAAAYENARAVTENAPHDSGCQFSFLPESKPRRCTCWKADVL